MRALAVGLALAASALVPSGSAGAADQYEWVALGDSYTVGGFVGAPQPPLGDASRDGCDRSTHAYPGVVEGELEEFPPGKYVHLTNVSCGNATIAEIADTKQTPVSPVQTPAGGWPAVDPQIQRANWCSRAAFRNARRSAGGVHPLALRRRAARPVRCRSQPS